MLSAEHRIKILNGWASAVNTHPALTSSPIKEANVAQPTVPPNPFPAQGRAQLSITAEEISKYPEIGAFALPFEAWE